MGNVELCGAPDQRDMDSLRIVGHIKNSQTRALLSILDACKVKYSFDSIIVPKSQNQKNTNTQGVQGQTDLQKNESSILRQKSIPMIVHNGFKIISDMPKFIFYLFENFKGEMLASGIWPKSNQEQIVYIFEWYAAKLRPFMWEFYGIMTATNQAGLTNTNSLEVHQDGVPENNQQLQKIHDEYLTRFKFICEEMEAKFFKGNNQFILGSEKPTCIDHVFYQEMLSAMVLSGNGSQSEFFSADTASRLYKLKNLTKWYRVMSSDKCSRQISDKFIQEMKLSNVFIMVDDGDKDDDDSSPQNTDLDKSARKSVKFAMDRSVRFGNDEEEIE